MINVNKNPFDNAFHRVVVYNSENEFVECFPICSCWSTEFMFNFVVTLSKGFPKKYIIDVE